MHDLARLSQNPRITIRRAGAPNRDGECVIYWMQRAQRGIDNPALDAAVEAANDLGKPVVVFLAPVPFYPHANLRHYRFLNQGIPDIAASLARKNTDSSCAAFPTTACCASAMRCSPRSSSATKTPCANQKAGARPPRRN